VANAKVAIERQSFELQTGLVAGSLTSEGAKVFLQRLTTVDTLIPAEPASGHAAGISSGSRTPRAPSRKSS
jgi:hypothetical protein